MAQVPSVGRIVHYVARGSADGHFKPVCRAAVIAAVDPDVALVVLNPNGMFFNEQCAYDESNAPGTWHWPEFVPPTNAPTITLED